MSAVEIIRLQRRALLQVMARRGADVAAAAQASFGLMLPPPGQAATTGDITALWIQPQGWMLVSADAALSARAAPLVGHAALVDQSHGRTSFAIAGARARDVLAKGCRIDLHPRAFGPGRVASTSIAHVNALLHQTAAERFEVTVFSTLTDHMQHWLDAASAEYR